MWFVFRINNSNMFNFSDIDLQAIIQWDKHCFKMSNMFKICFRYFKKLALLKIISTKIAKKLPLGSNKESLLFTSNTLVRTGSSDFYETIIGTDFTWHHKTLPNLTDFLLWMSGLSTAVCSSNREQQIKLDFLRSITLKLRVYRNQLGHLLKIICTTSSKILN